MSCPQCGCTVVETVNIPGLRGNPGANGANGQPAFTNLTASITFANTTNPVVASVVNSTWNAVNQVVLLSDGTNFATAKVTAVSPGAPTIVTLQYLGYNGDTGAPTGPVTINNGGSVVSAGRTITTPVSVVNGGTGSSSKTAAQLALGLGQNALIANSTGLTQNLTAAWAEVGTCDVTVSSVGSYLIFGQMAVLFSGVTFAGGHSIQLRIQNITHPATISFVAFSLPTVTTLSFPTTTYCVGFVLDATALASDHYQLQFQADAAGGLPSAGTCQAVSGNICAIPLTLS